MVILTQIAKVRSMSGQPQVLEYAETVRIAAEKAASLTKLFACLIAEFLHLKWAFADFDDECVRLDLPYIPEAKRAEMVRELEIRLQQMVMLLKVFKE